MRKATNGANQNWDERLGYPYLELVLIVLKQRNIKQQLKWSLVWNYELKNLSNKGKKN